MALSKSSAETSFNRISFPSSYAATDWGGKMRVHLRFLRRKERIRESLCVDGWQLERDKDDSVIAKHPLVKDETTARIRLQELGLLTSSSVHIEFIRSNGRYL